MKLRPRAMTSMPFMKSPAWCLVVSWLHLSLVAAATTLTAAEPTPARDLLLDAKRVVVLGDSITYGGGWVVPVIAWLEAEGWTGDVINMGLSSETVSGLSEDGHAGGKFPRPDLHERLARVLRVADPTW